ncbi:unnamed protein product [Protopolystoma xenopodis]|uniref:RNA helicase aquarius N-terminal domain-containing protein n=1 Tax=Protopolystoma xenopodis TaxID=117903 RepID=A0A3S5CMV1_9PLAT|nr:unnamed protein product [Protopolystoma xenopodis]
MFHFNIIGRSFRASSQRAVPRLLPHYLERCLLLFIDLLSMLMTRRFLHAILDDRHFVIRCQSAEFTRLQQPQSRLFSELVDMLVAYDRFPIDAATGEPLDDSDRIFVKLLP